MNGGVFLHEPPKAKLQDMLGALINVNRRCHVPSHMPEQDCLTRYHDRCLHGLSPIFNWQLHQIVMPHQAKVHPSDPLAEMGRTGAPHAKHLISLLMDKDAEVRLNYPPPRFEGGRRKMLGKWSLKSC